MPPLKDFFIEKDWNIKDLNALVRVYADLSRRFPTEMCIFFMRFEQGFRDLHHLLEVSEERKPRRRYLSFQSVFV